jgi:hypothetical protein
MGSIRDLTYLEIVRPIEGAADLLNSARRIGGLTLMHEDREDVPRTLVEISAASIVGEEGPLITEAPAPLFRIYDNDGLRLPLIERKAIPEVRIGGSFSSAANYLRNGRMLQSRQQRKRGEEPHYDILPIKKQLYEIQLRHDFPLEDSVPLTVDRIDFRFDQTVMNGAVELVLLPKIADKATRMLSEQAKRCASVLGALNRRVAYPNGFQRLEIPFARIEEDADVKQLEEFIKDLEKTLPEQIIAGMPQIVHHSAS